MTAAPKLSFPLGVVDTSGWPESGEQKTTLAIECNHCQGSTAIANHRDCQTYLDPGDPGWHCADCRKPLGHDGELGSLDRDPEYDTDAYCATCTQAANDRRALIEHAASPSELARIRRASPAEIARMRRGR